MIRHCAAAFYLRQPSNSGSGSIKQELTAVYKLTGVKPPELDQPKMPDEIAILYRHYGKISNITDCGLTSYSNLMGVKFRPDEVEILKDIDYVNQAVKSGMKPQDVEELFKWQN